jgi:hypothetical protein
MGDPSCRPRAPRSENRPLFFCPFATARAVLITKLTGIDLENPLIERKCPAGGRPGRGLIYAAKFVVLHETVDNVFTVRTVENY